MRLDRRTVLLTAIVAAICIAVLVGVLGFVALLAPLG